VNDIEMDAIRADEAMMEDSYCIELSDESEDDYESWDGIR